jgi:RsiW-degrading membrane proteinase PrsW (M82 family)
MDTSVDDVTQNAVPEPRSFSPLWYVFAVFISLIGGFLGAFGAVVQELRAGGFILLPILGAPIIEEGLKPTGVYLLLIRWPDLIRSQLFTAVLSALAGLTFGLLEALVYVTLYVHNPPDWFVTYRFTLPLVLHTTGSFIVGLAINQGLLDWAQGRSALPKRNRDLYFTAIALHAIFNTTAVVLAFAGVFDSVE